MAFPQVTSITETKTAVDGHHCVVDLPASVNAGDLLLLIHSAEGAVTALDTAPAGWTEKHNGLYSKGIALVYVKVAEAGDAGGTAEIILTGDAVGWAAQVYRITAWGGGVADVEKSSFLHASISTFMNPPSLTASWGSADNLWIAALCNADDDEYPLAWSTDYTDGLSSLTGGGGNGGGSVNSCRRERAVDTEDPASMGMTNTALGYALTIVVKPATAAVGASGVANENRRRMRTHLTR